ncbi:glycosyltransferase family 39 protein [Thalassobaculum sp.]|uniref:ArnT family glycosyltransferase n=1 Tax=Thalassobaculum sp. TaxID=2022740 RepID=UPI0032EC4B65
MATAHTASISPLRLALAWVLALTVLRVAGLAMSGLELHGDEAQYWSWAQRLDLGYFTKPPLIAWLIAATTAACGDAEVCVRASSPLLHAATAMGLYALGRALRDARTGMWAALLWITLPSVAFSSLIVSTDVPLLACWTVAVLALRRTLDSRDLGRVSWGWAAAAGIAIGLGLLAKYAMAYAAVGFALHLIFAREDRWILRDTRGLLILALAATILAPNLIWNAQHDFATVGHLGDNANLKGTLFNPGHVVEFLGQQFGVFGPIPFLVLLWRVIAWARGQASAAERYLLAFALPPLAVVVVQAFLSRANANWAVTAYPSAAVLVALWLTEAGRARAWRLWTVGPHLVASLSFLLLVAVWPTLALPYVSKGFARLSGWQAMSQQIRPILDRNLTLPVLMSDRMTMASLLYYLRDRLTEANGRDEGDARMPVWNWDWNHRPENHYELLDAYGATSGDPVLLITDWPDPRPIVEKFEHTESISALSVTSFGRTKRLSIWRLSGYRGH